MGYEPRNYEQQRYRAPMDWRYIVALVITALGAVGTLRYEIGSLETHDVDQARTRTESREMRNREADDMKQEIRDLRLIVCGGKK